jgi:hypothetical protein
LTIRKKVAIILKVPINDLIKIVNDNFHTLMKQVQKMSKYYYSIKILFLEKLKCKNLILMFFLFLFSIADIFSQDYIKNYYPLIYDDEINFFIIFDKNFINQLVP